MRRRTASAALAALALTQGCGTTIVRSGLPAGRTPDAYEERWRHGFFFGLVDASGADDVAKICPQGWSEMRTGAFGAASLLQFLTVGIYTPATVTVVCAKTPGDPPAPPGEGDLQP